MATTTAQLKAAADGSEAPAAKKSKKKLIMMLVPVLLVGGGGYFFMTKKSSGPEPPPKPGAVVTMEPITVNLEGGHFLKLGLALQATALAPEEPDGSRALDIAIDLFSNKSIAELSANKERSKIKAELREKVVEAYEHEVMDVYFTEFVMQ